LGRGENRVKEERIKEEKGRGRQIGEKERRERETRPPIKISGYATGQEPVWHRWNGRTLGQTTYLASRRLHNKPKR